MDNLKQIARQNREAVKRKACVGPGGMETDCKWLRAYVSWWCKNEKCIEWRGTNIPGVKNCSFWEAGGSSFG